MTNSEIFAMLKAMGVVRVNVHYSGGGDEGGVELVEMVGADGKVAQEREQYPDYKYNPETREYTMLPMSREQELNIALCKPVYNRYGSFAGEFYTSGTFVWDVNEGTIDEV